MNRIHNATNPNQGKFKRVLCVCSAGVLRSPTAAEILSQPPFNFNTRAAGIDSDFALIPVDGALLEWADEVVCMTSYQYEALRQQGYSKPIITLDIEDNYEFRDPELVKLITERYTEITKAEEEVKPIPVGVPGFVEVYSRPECVFTYCPTPGDCMPKNGCSSPSCTE